MRKLKNLLATVSVAVMCAVPMFNTFSANAEADVEESVESASITQYYTYVVYADVAKTGIADFEMTFSYNSDVTAEPSEKTSLCDNGTFNSIHYTINRKIVTTYKGSAISQKDTLATTKMLLPYPATDGQGFYDKVTINTVAKNASGNNMGPSAISYDAVLLGDANNDGVVDMADVVLIQQVLSNPDKFTIANRRAADVNGGGITAMDALLIQQFVAGLIEHF